MLCSPRSARRRGGAPRPVESGFTPGFAQSADVVSAKGGVMGLYSTLLSSGAAAGSLVAAALGEVAQVDGLLIGTVIITCSTPLSLRCMPGRTP